MPLHKAKRAGPPFYHFHAMLGKNLMAGVHVDKNNERGLPNAILKISTFNQGGIWVECDTGSHACPAPGRSDLAKLLGREETGSC